jgi:hypothetical protein
MIDLYEKSHKDLEDDYESQQLNEFYNQEEYNQDKKEKLEKIRDSYKQGKLQLLKNGYVNNVSIYDR